VFLLLASGILLVNAWPPAFNVDPKDATEVNSETHKPRGGRHFWVCGAGAHREGGNVTGPIYPGDVSRSGAEAVANVTTSRSRKTFPARSKPYPRLATGVGGWPYGNL
jgi:hypothetical protein